MQTSNFHVILGEVWNTNAKSLRAKNRDVLKSYESMNKFVSAVFNQNKIFCLKLKG